MTTLVERRAYGRLLRIAVQDTLDDLAPRPLRTRDIQRAFSPRNIQRVYSALRSLENAKLITHYSTIDCSWWASKLVPPVCREPGCAEPARRVATWTVTDSTSPTGWRRMCGYSCGTEHMRGYQGQRWWVGGDLDLAQETD